MKERRTYPISGMILFLLSMIYLGTELFFNVMLLDISSSVRSDPQQVEQLQYFGRMASGLGFTLLVLGLFQRFGFRIAGRKQWLVFAAVAFICILPFLMTFGQILWGMAAAATVPGMSYTPEIVWSLLPFLGLHLVIHNRGRTPFIVVLGLTVLAWPTMFYGQKLAVERFVIAPTTAQQRLDANYVLLLKAGIEDCVIALEGVQFCDAAGAGADAERRSTRALLGPLFMLDAEEVFKSLDPEQGRIIEIMATRGLWFSAREYYQYYFQKVTAERDRYEQALSDNYYLPYKQASDLYLKSSNPESLKKISDDAVHKIEAGIRQGERQYQDLAFKVEEGIEQGWRQYRKAVSDYQDIVNDMAAEEMQKAEMMENAYKRDCQGDDCSRSLREKYDDYCRSGACAGMSLDYVMKRVNQAAEQNFYEASGYPSNIRDKASFLKNPKTQKKLREDIEKNLRDAANDKDFKLPEGWKYDRLTFRDYLQPLRDGKLRADIEENLRNMTQDRDFKLPQGWKYDPAVFRPYLQKLIRQKAQEGWKNKVQAQLGREIPPGLDREAFFRHLEVEPLPPPEKLALSESEFMQNYIIPLNEKISYDALEKIREEAPFYANGEKLAEQGKDYIRVLYIPAIALCVSLIIVVLTIGRNLVSAVCRGVEKSGVFRRLTAGRQNALRPACWGVFLALVFILPYLWPNPYTASAAYRKYYHLAREKSPPAAILLDWVVHMQPVIYRVGEFLRGRSH